MGKNGSQLKNLKSSIRQANLGTRPNNKKSRTRSTESHEDRQAKVQKIQSDFNLFDRQFTKRKFDVGGRRVKGTEGKPGVSRGVGEELRRRTIGAELKKRNRSGAIIDRRFGENNPHLSVEEKMLERFSREQQRRSKRELYNLDAEDVLTHGNRPLSDIDSFEEPGFGLDEGEELNDEVVRRMHFGGFEDSDAENEKEGEGAHKSKREVMSEIIAKSKHYKAERQAEKERYEDEREKLDEQMEDLQSFLSDYKKASRKSGIKTQRPIISDGDARYDSFVREMVFDKRAHPTERTKTEEELAQIEADRLRELEDQRISRMEHYQEDSASEAGSIEDEQATDNVFGFGKGLEQENEEEWNGINEEAEESEDEESVNSDTSFVDDEQLKVEEQPLVGSAIKNEGSEKASLAYTYPCPTSHVEFVQLLKGLDYKDYPTVVSRIRTLHHVKLHPDNKSRLENFSVILLQHILHLTRQPMISMELLEHLTEHLHSLAQQFPSALGISFISVVEGMRKRLAKSYVYPEIKFPEISDLLFFNLTGSIFPTSDKKHIVVSPVMLTMAESLSQSPADSLSDVCKKLYIANLFLKFQSYSHRYVPEVITAVSQALYLLYPNFISIVPGTFALPDSLKEKQNLFAIQDISLDEPQRLSLYELEELPTGLLQSSILFITLNLIEMAIDIYFKEQAFIEIFVPIMDMLQLYSLKKELLSKRLSEKLLSTLQAVSDSIESAKANRKPLALQSHRPLGITSQVPKFEEGYSLDKSSHDIDPERAQLNKLRAQHRDAKKGAIRTLRKDARFIARERRQEQRAKDQAYNEKMRKLENRLQHFDPAV
ncbi:U3 snoRNP-associated protein Nop14 [Schizosaccharomyces pombe]|uniref:Probable nucleolar complex protein 14 n=1 Tax=Schizosaccharomyces pombe (strain 972 / ATCC 24843) TaxID=284812 RepID=NOP14_SCHPO|nr:putative U3 snoRNP protein Nop14 [Schizosaccharomyces pombe]O43051.1 RecName: Full=Probable nucleolar complex protein 14 [Schizosaccharomyces pombe 972h-]CAA17693.1 U3 snoRNP protein Nop14 (predicted) [Schizosaccharomyces pombe]|eukprot:NP_596742.1 putative U3 snoRNP protein Nop14 [Schizosaccharomyces pombe]